MTICCLGDLVLDVIVRLEQPLATGADATSRIVLRPGRPGGERRRLDRGARRHGRGSSASGAPTTRALSPRRGCSSSASSSSARSSPPGTASSSRSSIPRASGRCAPTAASPPSSARRRSTRRGSRTATHLHVSGYALLREPVRFAAIRAIEHARAHGARVSVDLSSWSAIRDFGAERFRAQLEELAPDVVFANEDEDADRRRPDRRVHAGSSSAARPARRSTATSAPPARSTEVVDSTGAGDAFAAGWLVGGPDLALEAARALRPAAPARCPEPIS